jgi:hypothetical protein
MLVHLLDGGCRFYRYGCLGIGSRSFRYKLVKLFIKLVFVKVASLNQYLESYIPFDVLNGCERDIV